MIKIPEPITFNPHKHHFGFLDRETESWRNLEPEEIERKLLYLGENLLDFYTGKLTVEKICTECLTFFKEIKVNNYETFLTWLHPGEYRKIRLSDSSVWVIKTSLNPERYIHIHPAKQSPYSIRVRAATLKTVTALNAFSIPIQNDMRQNLRKVNVIRKDILHLSPVKLLHPKNGIFYLWKRFANDFRTE